MEATRVTISEQTKSYYDKPLSLSPAKHRQLKIAHVIEHIEQKKGIATVGELVIAAGYQSHVSQKQVQAAGTAFISNLVKSGYLKKEPFLGHKKKWTVLKLADNKPATQKPPVSLFEKQTETVKPAYRLQTFNVSELEVRAKQFYWDTQSDSLHDFIKVLKEGGQSNAS